MSDLRAYVANCLMGGHTITTRENGWIRDTIEFNCGGRTFFFVQKAHVVNGQFAELKGRFCETSEVVVKGVQIAEVPKVLKAIDAICWLLSFAGLSRVVRYGHDYPDGTWQGVRSSAVGYAAFFRPTIDIRDGAEVKSFIEQAFPNYVRLERARKLNVVVDYLLQAERISQPTECRLVFAFILLESLKSTFAHSKAIPYVKGAFIKPPSGRAKKYQFEELLQIMFREVGMRRGLKRIVRLRNQIIHSGISQHSHARQWAMYERIHDLLREYLLRLLGFHGEYLTYSSGSNAHASV